MAELTREEEGKWKQYQRLLISYNDFKQASDIAYYFINGDYVVDREEWGGDDYYEKRIIGEALNVGVIVSYARPFSGNDKKSKRKIPDMPQKYIRLLADNEKQIHKLVLERRNTTVAHSDSDAWDMAPHTLTLSKGNKMVLPISNDVFAPLTIEEMKIVCRNCTIFMDAIIEERKSLEEQFVKYLPEVGIWDENNG